MLRVRSASFELSPKALLAGELRILRVEVAGVDALLETDDAGRANWQFASRTPAAADAASGPDSGRATSLELDHVIASDVRVSLPSRQQGEARGSWRSSRWTCEPRACATGSPWPSPSVRSAGRSKDWSAAAPSPAGRQGGLAVRPEARHRGRDAGRGRHARHRAAHRHRRGRRVGQGHDGSGPGTARRRRGRAALAAGPAHDPALERRQAARRSAPPRARRPGDRRPRHAERPAGAPAARRRAGGEGDRRRQASRRRAGRQGRVGRLDDQGQGAAVRRHAAAADRLAADRHEARPRDQAAAACPTSRRCRR